MGEWGHYQNVGELISLSTKHLVDCSRANFGCGGGWYDQAFDFMKSPGLVDEDTYPYVASQSACPALPAAVSKLASYRLLPSNNEAGMLKALKDGPIAVAVFTDDGWYSYGGGVYTSAFCNNGTEDVDHAVVVVGAGVDGETGTPFWLIRNSWGADWGEGGYMRCAATGWLLGLAAWPGCWAPVPASRCMLRGQQPAPHPSRSSGCRRRSPGWRAHPAPPPAACATSPSTPTRSQVSSRKAGLRWPGFASIRQPPAAQPLPPTCHIWSTHAALVITLPPPLAAPAGADKPRGSSGSTPPPSPPAARRPPPADRRPPCPLAAATPPNPAPSRS
jgi:hypothetical protein